MEIKPDEKVSAFLDRLYAILSGPMLRLKEKAMLRELYAKIPKYYRKNIRRWNLNIVQELRSRCIEIETDYQH